MKKTTLFITAALMAGSYQASAVINDSKFGTPGELFVTVWDEAGSKSFYKDLGINMTDFMSGKNCIHGDFSTDPNWTAIASAANLKFSVAAVNSLLADRSNIQQWGYLATSSEGQGIFGAGWNQIDNTRQKIQAYIGDLNYPTAFAAIPGQELENKSGLYKDGEIGYSGRPSWGKSIGSSVGGNTYGPVGNSLDFYFVNNSNGQADGQQVTKLGNWMLSGGKLGFTGVGSAPVPQICGGGSTNYKLTISKSGNGSVASSPAGISCGSTCAADFQAGSKVTLTATPDSGATFTNWGGACTGTAPTCDVTVDAAVNVSATFSSVTPPPVGPYIDMTAPANWVAKQKQTITWVSSGLSSKSTVTLKFSKNGGSKYKTLKSGIKQTAGTYSWKPAKADVTSDGVLQACTKPDPKKSAQVCDTVRIVVTK